MVGFSGKGWAAKSAQAQGDENVDEVRKKTNRCSNNSQPEDELHLPRVPGGGPLRQGSPLGLRCPPCLCQPLLRMPHAAARGEGGGRRQKLSRAEPGTAVFRRAGSRSE